MRKYQKTHTFIQFSTRILEYERKAEQKITK